MNRPRNNGFTLIELIVVITIVSVLLVGLMTTFVQIQKLLNKQSEAAYRGQQAEETYLMIARDIQNMVFEKWNQKYFFKAEKIITAGRRLDFFNFITGNIYSNPLLLQTRVFNVTYFGDADEITGDTVLYRKEDMIVDYKNTVNGIAIPVLQKVSEFKIEFSRNGDDWLDSWDFSTIKNLPRFVKITIKYKLDDELDGLERIMEIQTSPGIFM